MEASIKEIILACGSKAQVSDEDFEFLSAFNWCLSGSRGNGYVTRRTIDGAIYLHYEVLRRMNILIPKGMEPDHKDRDTLNNQRENLRVVTKSQNRHNTTLQHNNTSGHRGVNYSEKQRKWVARISVNKRRIILGTFAKLEEAVAARLAAEKRYKIHG